MSGTLAPKLAKRLCVRGVRRFNEVGDLGWRGKAVLKHAPACAGPATVVFRQGAGSARARASAKRSAGIRTLRRADQPAIWGADGMGVAGRAWLRKIGGVKKDADMIDPKVLMAYDRWVARHFDELVKNHAGKYIAVYRDKLVAVADTHKEVLTAAERLNPMEPPLTMQVPGIEDIEAIL